MGKEEIQQKAFEIISYAGDAMDQFYQAILDYKHHDLKSAAEKYQKGKEYLQKTHLIQTQLIQCEIDEEELPYSLLMTHAQDHLNSAINWQRMVTLLLDED